MNYPVELKYITLAQIIGCSLVILGHSFPFITPYPEGVSRAIEFLYTFHMPLFVWCSGFLFAHTQQSDRKTFEEYLKSRATKLLVPYIALSLIGLLPKIMATPVLNDTLELDALQIFRAFVVPRENIWGHFWFLPMIFLMGIIAYIVDKVTKTLKGWILLTVLAFCASFYQHDLLEWGGVNDVMAYFFFYCMGILCCRAKILNSSTCYTLASVICFILSLILFINIEGEQWLIHTRNTLIAVLMITGIVQLCKVTENDVKINRKSLVAQTYQIYILSWPCQLVAGIIAERLLHISWMAFIPIVFFTGMIMPLLLIRIIDWFEKRTSTRFMSLILGR